MQLHITHTTTYRYDSAVSDSVNEARLCPRNSPTQHCHCFALHIAPAVPYQGYQDFFQNTVNVFQINSPHQALKVTAISEVQTQADTRTPPGPICLKELSQHISYDQHYDYLVDSQYIQIHPAIWRQAIDISSASKHLGDYALQAMDWVYQNFEYNTYATTVNTSMAQAFAIKKGVCQDYAHVLIGLMRSLKIPTRYVSGYFWTPDANQDASAGASHAWVEIHIPQYGWLGLDPTHNCITDTRYVKIANGRDYHDVRPLNGSYNGPPVRHLEVSVTVEEQSSQATAG